MMLLAPASPGQLPVQVGLFHEMEDGIECPNMVVMTQESRCREVWPSFDVEAVTAVSGMHFFAETCPGETSGEFCITTLPTTLRIFGH
jgi:hypothetical protein